MHTDQVRHVGIFAYDALLCSHHRWPGLFSLLSYEHCLDLIQDSSIGQCLSAFQAHAADRQLYDQPSLCAVMGQ